MSNGHGTYDDNVSIMNAVRLEVGILLVASSALWAVDNIWYLMGMGTLGFSMAQAISFVANILGVLAGLVLLFAARNEGTKSLDWRFDLIVGALLLVSATVYGGLSFVTLWGYSNVPQYSLDSTAAVIYLVATILLVIFAQNVRPLNLPLPEAGVFGFLLLVDYLLATIAEVSSGGNLQWGFLGASSQVIGLVSMIIFLYSHYSRK